ncbi:aquaglyceroporin [Hepatocystis sp. ex Piliocolobus tephrosceles]|nr:aquaglyceroporin [Hepatocystis sp. ex Piliocolobus tephrosceles]
MATEPFYLVGKEFLGEFIGTFILMFIGEGSTALYTISNNDDWFRLCIGWGIAVFMGIFFASKLSAAHLNLAVTLTLSFMNKFDYKKIPCYFIAQLLGAFSATAAVYGMYYGYIQGRIVEKFVWETMRDHNVSISNAFAHECILTGFLILVILFITDEDIGGEFNILKVAGIIGFTVTTIGITFGKNTGFALNPSRDFGARLLSLIVQGSKVFTDGTYYFWVPIIAPILGGIISGFLYRIVIKPLMEMKAVDNNNEKI